MTKLFRGPLLLAAALICTACGGGGDSASSAITNTPTSQSGAAYRPAQTGDVYTNVLVACLGAQPQRNPCTVGTLPFIGQTSALPTKATILAQTIVTHPWMATRFAEVLDQMPTDIFLLFRGVTGVVIGADIRPSHYDAVTGAIYLDPADLWVTAAERATISQVPDFRDGFGDGLAFTDMWRYVQGNHYAWDSLPLSSTVSSRPASDLVLPMADLLFHELAHANDFTPPAVLSQLNPNKTAWANVSVTPTSSNLTLQYPLQSTLLFDFAKILYHGVTATDAQKLVDGTQIGASFATDGASASYSYSSQYEDTAMLFEEVMMKYHFNIDREQAFSTAPLSSNPNCSDFIVRWGQRNRVGDPQVKARAEIVVRQILGINDASAYVATIPAPRNLIAGVDWCTNLEQMSISRNFKQIVGGSNASASRQTGTPQKVNASDIRPPHARLMN